MYPEDDFLMISALQHYLFCPRQCALIYVEQTWSENRYPVEGQLLRAQHCFVDDKITTSHIIKSILCGKILNSRTVIRRAMRDHL